MVAALRGQNNGDGRWWFFGPWKFQCNIRVFLSKRVLIGKKKLKSMSGKNFFWPKYSPQSIFSLINSR